MVHYRIYPVGADGTIVLGESVECDTDDEAMSAAAELIGPHPLIEVWCGSRRVCLLTSEEVAAYRRN